MTQLPPPLPDVAAPPFSSSFLFNFFSEIILRSDLKKKELSATEFLDTLKIEILSKRQIAIISLSHVKIVHLNKDFPRIQQDLHEHTIGGSSSESYSVEPGVANHRLWRTTVRQISFATNLSGFFNGWKHPKNNAKSSSNNSFKHNLNYLLKKKILNMLLVTTNFMNASFHHQIS